MQHLNKNVKCHAVDRPCEISAAAGHPVGVVRNLTNQVTHLRDAGCVCAASHGVGDMLHPAEQRRDSGLRETARVQRTNVLELGHTRLPVQLWRWEACGQDACVRRVRHPRCFVSLDYYIFGQLKHPKQAAALLAWPIFLPVRFLVGYRGTFF